MQRVTISLDETLAEAFDALTRQRGYESRSEAVRDLVREAVEKRRLEEVGAAHCIANLSYVYDHETRGIAGRLAQLGHDHHDLVLATNQTPLDHRTSFANTTLRGRTAAVRDLADRIVAERGVRFGKLNIISVEPNDRHDVGPSHEHSGRAHLSPQPG